MRDDDAAFRGGMSISSTFVSNARDPPSARKGSERAGGSGGIPRKAADRPSARVKGVKASGRVIFGFYPARWKGNGWREEGGEGGEPPRAERLTDFRTARDHSPVTRDDGNKKGREEGWIRDVLYVSRS